MEIPYKCAWCLNEGVQRCSRCQSVYYCSREHQIEHWSDHKKVCKKPTCDTVHQVDTGLEKPIDSSNQVIKKSFPTGNHVPENNSWCQSDVANSENDLEHVNYPSDEDDLFSTLNSESLSSDNNFWNIISCGSAQGLCDTGAAADIAELSCSFQDVEQLDPNTKSEPKLALLEGAPLQSICQSIVNDLNSFGICVLDNFLGEKLGLLILSDVHRLYSTGIFKKGELVIPNLFHSKESIRSDVTTWVDGSEEGCSHIGILIKKLDLVVTTCNKLANNGQLSNYKLHRRTKAMIACYPGDGTNYKKHIDNPYKDGRCITCIYYLNRNWDLKKQGGLLRMFPSSHATQMVDITPTFDRMIFFWSDKRNPHEVQPSYSTRFAITVWYFDADEREKALLAYKSRQAANFLS